MSKAHPGIEQYPLAWPAGWPRTPRDALKDGKYQFRRPVTSRASPFWTFADARGELFAELRRLGAADVILSSNFRVDKRTGLAVEGGERRPLDQGIAIYFTLAGRPKTMARDSYLRAEENMRSLALTIEALRAIERHGGGMMLDRAFEGFAALPPPVVTPPPRPWHEVLGVARNAGAEEISAAYRAKAKAAHPDAGGSESAMADLNSARDAGMAGLK